MQSHLSAAHFHSEEAAYEFAEARLWPEGPVCPHCGATKEHVGRLKGKTNRIGFTSATRAASRLRSRSAPCSSRATYRCGCGSRRST